MFTVEIWKIKNNPKMKQNIAQNTTIDGEPLKKIKVHFYINMYVKCCTHN